MYRKYLIVFLSILLLSSLCAVSAFADDPSGEGGASTGTDVLTDLVSGWYDSSYGYKTGYGTSWFWRIQESLATIKTVLNDLKSSWTSSSYPTGYSGSWFQQILVAVRGISSGSSSSAWTSTQASNVNNKIDGIYNQSTIANSWLSGISSYLSNGLNWSSSDVTSVVTDIDSLDTNTNLIKGYSQNISTKVTSIDSSVDDVESKLDTLNGYINSIRTYIYNIRSYVSDIKTVVASSNALTAHNNQVNNAGAVLSDFLSGSSSSSSLGVSDVHGIKNVVGLGDTYLSSSASISDAPAAFSDAFSSSGGLGFWSQDVADELNGVQPLERGLLRGVEDPAEPEIVTHYYEDSVRAVEAWFNRGDSR